MAGVTGEAAMGQVGEVGGGATTAGAATRDTPSDLAPVRRGRADVHGVLVELEAALAAPAAGRLEAWAGRVREALIALGAAFERHIAVTEGTDGLFAAVRSRAPRLNRAVADLTTAHRDIRRAVGEALDTVQRAADAPGRPPTEARDAVLAVLDQLMRHRQDGADLVYEAYAVDIGEGD